MPVAEVRDPDHGGEARSASFNRDYVHGGCNVARRGAEALGS